MAQKKESAYPHRIQVRLDGKARDGLDKYRAENGGLSISEGVRRLIMKAPIGPIIASSGPGRRDIYPQPVAPYHPRYQMKKGRRPGEGFIKFFMNPSDIGVHLDQKTWNHLCTYALRRELILSEAVREICICGTRPILCVSAGRRLSSRLGEDLDKIDYWNDD